MGTLIYVDRTHSVSPDVLPSYWTEERVARLAAMNKALRLLRSLDYRVLHVDLDAQRYGRPEIEIERVVQSSLVPLLDRANELFWKRAGGFQWGHVDLYNAIVMWEEL